VDLTERLVQARMDITDIFKRCLTLSGPNGWQTQARFPFIQVGTPGMYNITAGHGVLGAEVRPIPQDDLSALKDELQNYCDTQGLQLQVSVIENGIACNPQNVYLKSLIQAVKQASGQEISIGKKLPGTSARFAPAGQGVVWGQTGLGPHSRSERHFIPSILPYYRALGEYGKLLLE
jgi:hypothetical protein